MVFLHPLSKDDIEDKNYGSNYDDNCRNNRKNFGNSSASCCDGYCSARGSCCLFTQIIHLNLLFGESVRYSVNEGFRRAVLAGNALLVRVPHLLSFNLNKAKYLAGVVKK